MQLHMGALPSAYGAPEVRGAVLEALAAQWTLPRQAVARAQWALEASLGAMRAMREGRPVPGAPPPPAEAEDAIDHVVFGM